MAVPQLDRARASALVDRFARLKILVVGDVMVDRFIVGSVTRISPEAPVPVVRFRSEHFRLGGAANVAHNVAALGAKPVLVGLVGRDEAGDRLRRQLAAEGIGDEGLVEDSRRPTTEKTRVVTERNQQVARIDFEDDVDADAATEARIVARVARLGTEARAMLVSDYLKGAISRPVVDALVAAQDGSRLPLVVDPKVPHLACYAGATLITPNLTEAEAATHCRIRSDDDARQAARAFRRLAACEAVLMTMGERGMWLSSVDCDDAIAASAREVADVTGAGDTVAATVAVALAAGASLPEAAALANHAAGVVVEKFGAATVTPDELLASIG